MAEFLSSLISVDLHALLHPFMSFSIPPLQEEEEEEEEEVEEGEEGEEGEEEAETAPETTPQSLSKRSGGTNSPRHISSSPAIDFRFQFIYFPV